MRSSGAAGSSRYCREMTGNGEVEGDTQPASRVAAVIPARMASARFPGKPLKTFNGIPMVEQVRRRATLAGAFTDVVVATCDEEIARAVESCGGRVVMTSAAHPGATDRVAEAAEHLDCTHVVNVQGDEILVRPDDLRRMAHAITAAPWVPAWNAVARIERSDDLGDRSIVKCVVSRTGRVLFCSRDLSLLPLVPPFEPVRKILGVLAYERSFLARYASLERTPLEVLESIDQSRILEHDEVLRGVEFEGGYLGLNEPSEVALVERYLADDPTQQMTLRSVLGS